MSMFEKVSITFCKDDIFTPTEIELLLDAVKQLDINPHSKYYEVQRHQTLKKIDALAYGSEHIKSIKKVRK